jgi:serine/threonine protein kinase
MSKDTQKAFAAKKFKIPIKSMNSYEERSYKRELKYLQETSHPFVVKFIEEFVYYDKKIIITELASGGDLAALMESKEKITEDEAMNYFTMILIGLHYLH